MKGLPYLQSLIMNLEQISYILSSISLVFYSIVYVPQFYVIYKSKTSDGISFWMLLLWTQADILSLLGTIVLYMPSSIIIIGWYHYTIGIAMIIFVLCYTNKYTDYGKENGNGNVIVKGYTNNFILKCGATFVFLFLNTFLAIILYVLIDKSYDEIGAALGWITMSFYLIGRVPQIWLNYKRKSTEGLSLLMYIFTMCGNGVYLGVITIDPDYIQSNMPWIITGVTSILMDIFVIGQHYYYIG